MISRQRYPCLKRRIDTASMKAQIFFVSYSRPMAAVEQRTGRRPECADSPDYIY